MADYIDRNNECIDIWDTTGQGGGSCPIDPTPDNPTDENLARWDWLIKGWDSMSFKERYALFMPKVHIICIPDTKPADFDEEINNQIAEYSYKWCRRALDIQSITDDHRVPYISVVYDGICIDSIPDSEIKAKVRAWTKSVFNINLI